jgi:hypothetical protein
VAGIDGNRNWASRSAQFHMDVKQQQTDDVVQGTESPIPGREDGKSLNLNNISDRAVHRSGTNSW